MAPTKRQRSAITDNDVESGDSESGMSEARQEVVCNRNSLERHRLIEA